jgi:hypothetical protein
MRLREDYVSGMIFTTAFYILVGVFAGILVSFYFLTPWWFWLSVSGFLLGLGAGVLRFKLRFFETLDALTPGALFWLSMHYIENAISGSNLASLIAFGFLILLMVLFYVLDSRYKRLSWYKSGRIGFAGLTVLGTFFLTRAVVAATFPFVLSFVGTADIIMSSVFAFFAFLSVFNLARQQS